MTEPLSQPLQQLLDTFATDHLEGGTASEASHTLCRAVSGSPWLAQLMNRALTEGHLKKLDILPEDDPAGGSYRDGTIRLRLEDFDPERVSNLLWVLAHETQHALFDDAARTRQIEQDFFDQVKALAASDGSKHDYTPILAGYRAFRAEDEARAEIAGWNAVVSYWRQENPVITFAEVADKTQNSTAGIIDDEGTDGHPQLSLKPGLTLNPDLSMSDSETNVQAMTEYYFNRPGRAGGGLGHHKDSNYSNYYLGDKIDAICGIEAIQQQRTPDREPPQLILGMQQLHLSERSLERNGRYLGGEGKQCRYFDSDEPDRPYYFDHTDQTHEYIPNEPDGTRLPTPVEPLDNTEVQGGSFEHGDVLPRSDEALPEETPEPDVQPEPDISPSVQRLKDDLDEQLKPKLLATGCCSELHADAMVAEGVKRCVEQGAESVVCAGIDEGHNRLVLQTDKKYNGLLVYDSIEASRVEPEQTLREADRLARGEQEQQRQQIQEQAIQLDAEFLEQQEQQQTQQQAQQQQEFVHRLVREQEDRIMRTGV